VARAKVGTERHLLDRPGGV